MSKHWPADYQGPYGKGDTQEGKEGIVYSGEVSGYGFRYEHPVYYPLVCKLLSEQFRKELEGKLILEPERKPYRRKSR